MQVRDLFIEAIQKPSTAERAEFLAQSCGPNTELRRDVEELLVAHYRDELFILDMPPSGLGDTLASVHPTEFAAGAQIGAYKLRSVIGEGGMGIVYLAEQTTPVKRQVALKIIKPGMDSRQVIARFEAERQALAMMDHPNIAKVLDAGTTETGRPYFVMELVRGIPINDFCDQKRLNVRQRLQLFIPVCQAVQHAHQNGIIHRDLKPTNVLVTSHDSVAVPKVIDFGIAKALGQQLTDHTLLTGFSQMIGTPLYMSPEQADMNQLGVDTRSDVYSLGVMLYELLTGSTPFDKESLTNAGLDEMRRVIRDQEPLKPSARVSRLQAQALSTVSDRRSSDPRRISMTLRGELDWIVMKTLDKDRNRRYESASGLARDIERFLAHEPISARPASLSYRVRKWFHRKPASGVGAIAAALIALALTLGGWYHVYQLDQANLALDAANHGFKKANDDLNSALATSRRLQNEAIEREHALRLHQYVDDTRLAWRSWDDGRTDDAMELLRRYELQPVKDDVRGFEWHLLAAHCPPPIRTLRGHENSILTTDISPDGKWIASGDSGGVVRIWELTTGREVKSFQYGDQEVKCVRFAPNGKLLATTGMDRSVHLWNVSDWMEAAVLKGQEHTVNSLAWSPDSTQIAAGGFDNQLFLWNVEQQGNARSLAKFKAQVRCVAWSPDGKALAATASDDGLQVWNTATWESTRFEQDHGSGAALALAFTSDGKWLASAGYAGHLVIHDTEKQLVAGYSKIPSSVWSLRFSQDDKQLLVGNGDGFVLSCHLNLTTGQLSGSQQFRLGEGEVTDIAFAQGGGLVVTAHKESRLVDVRKAEHLTLPHQYRYSARCTSISPIGELACAIDTATGVGRLLSFPPGQDFGKLSSRQGEEFNDAQFLPPGDRLALLGKTQILLYDIPAKRQLGALEDLGFFPRQFVVSPDGKLIAGSGGRANYYQHHIWDTTTHARVGSHHHTLKSFVVQMAFSPDNRLLATSAFDGPIYLWDLASGEQRAELQEKSVYDLKFSPDGQTLAVAHQQLSLWDINSVTKVATLQGHTDDCHGVAYSPDGRTLASISKETVCLSHVPTLQDVGLIYRHSLPLTQIQFLTPHQLVAFSEPVPNSPTGANDVLLFDVSHISGETSSGHIPRLQAD